MGQLQKIYSSAVVTVNERNYIGEEVNRLMVESHDPSQLLSAWSQWRDSIGPQSRKLYQQMVDILNDGARTAGRNRSGLRESLH